LRPNSPGHAAPPSQFLSEIEQSKPAAYVLKSIEVVRQSHGYNDIGSVGANRHHLVQVHRFIVEEGLPHAVLTQTRLSPAIINLKMFLKLK
jgi:hypothetical protein